VTRNSASADSSPHVGLPGRYQHNPVPRRHASMLRRTISEILSQPVWRDVPAWHWTRRSFTGPAIVEDANRQPACLPGQTIRVGHVDRRMAIQVGLGASFLFALHNESSCRFSIHLFNSTACCRPSTSASWLPFKATRPAIAIVTQKDDSC
jgi:hypothetical protein